MFTHRDVEDLLDERGLKVPYETFRHWVLKFCLPTAKGLRLRRPKPSSRWYLYEMAVRIAG